MVREGSKQCCSFAEQENVLIFFNGVFTAKIIDYTDFEYLNGKSVTNIPNNWGYNMQQKGNYKNYFNVIEIERKLR